MLFDFADSGSEVVGEGVFSAIKLHAVEVYLEGGHGVGDCVRGDGGVGMGWGG